MALTTLSETRCFGGRQLRLSHASQSCKCDMTFAAFLPAEAANGPVPVMIWLSGLTCNDENFTQKAGAQRYAAEHGMALIAPDTSPRGDGVPDDPDGAYDFGLAAGFYVNATETPWATHYHMYDYITQDLPEALGELPVDLGRAGIAGHSMGGHGALTIALKNPGVYKSVSAFAPIVSPMNCPWGHKALGGYLGPDQTKWAAHDAVALIADAPERLPLLVDQGRADGFLDEQLKPELLRDACDTAGHPLELRLHDGYDHSYFFIATFIGDHVSHHAAACKS
ncbi:MAG: S-formylglutathione hydrolase [Hyphomicrobiaceae bacterium]